ncbi:MAG TPA: TonB family protein [Gammaproteobacteria bacterium]
MISRPSSARKRRCGTLGLLSLGVACVTFSLGSVAQQTEEPPAGGTEPAAETDASPPESGGGPSADEAAPGSDSIGDGADVEETAEADSGRQPHEAGSTGQPDEGDVASLETQPPVTRLEALLELNRLAEEERYDDALPIAERFVALTEDEFGAESLEAAEAYARAGRVQSKAEEHELAEQSYLHAVELIRNIDGTFSERAISPLMGLGDSYQAAGQYLNAITAYNEARTINRRVFGLLNEGQIPILDRLTESFRGLNQYEEADARQREILHLAERNYEEGSPEYLEAIYRYAGWLRESGRYTDERSEYARAMRIIRDRYGKESPYLARPLRETANSYRTQRLLDNQGISSLRSALELLDQQGGGDPLIRAEVLRDLGDWEVAFSKVEPDLSSYLTAWQLLGEVENGDELRAQWFGELTNVFGEPISQRGLSDDPDALSGFVIVQFGVDRFGKPENVRIARSEPPGFKDEAVLRAVRRWRFRPYIENGVIVPKESVALQFNYRYLPNEEDDEDEGE